MSPEQAAAFAIERHPVFRIGEMRIRQAEARLQHTGIRPNPVFDAGLRTDFVDENDGEFAVELGLRQILPNTARLEREKDLRRIEVDLARAELAEARHRLVVQVWEAATEHALASGQRTLLREQLEVNQGTVAFLQERVAAAEASTLDVKQAQLTSRELEAKLRTLELSQIPSGLKVKRLLGLNPDDPVRITLPFDLPTQLPALPPPDWSHHPDLVLARTKIQAADAGIAYADSQAKEDMSVGLLLNHDRAKDRPRGLSGNTFLGVGLSVPLPLRRQNEGQVAQARTALETARAELAFEERELRHAYAAASAKREAAWMLAREANGEIITLADSILEDMRAAQLAGQVPYLQVQRALEKLIALRSTGLEATLDYHRADSALRGAFHGHR